MVGPVLAVQEQVLDERDVRTLAIFGGQPVRTLAPPPWPYYDDDEIDAVVSVLHSGKVNQWTGTQVAEFQSEFSAMHLGRGALAVANGTLALELALQALGVGPGDEVIVPARSFMASASCIDRVGATPVFADVDSATQLITAAEISRLITPRTRAVIVVHLNGRPCDMPAIMALALRKNLHVIEDCAQCLGAGIDGRPLGTFGDAAAFSFCQDKIVSTGGEGAMLLFGSGEVWKRAWSLRDHGKTIESISRPSQPGYRWLHEKIGTNARMTGMQAAIGRRQLAKLSGWIDRRNQIAARLACRLAAYDCIFVPPVAPGHTHARYRLEFSVRREWLKAGWSRDRILQALMAEGIAVATGTCPEIYREAAYADRDCDVVLANARLLGQTSLVLLTHPTIDERYLRDCEVALAKVLGAACV
jgi:dTDP-4-amino-4,6-dideoxygalactose transaminase